MSSENSTGNMDRICKQLQEPFSADDIEWRAGSIGADRHPRVQVMAYLTARAVQQRLDDVVGASNWYSTQASMLEFAGIVMLQVGIAIRCDGEWITKYDAAEPTKVESVKGGYSAAFKRAAVQWGIGRYLYHLTNMYAEVQVVGRDESRPRGEGWRYQKHKVDGLTVCWKPPQLPSWALPEWDAPISEEELKQLKRAWHTKFGRNTAGAEAGAAFARFVHERVGQFPHNDYRAWTRRMHGLVATKIEQASASGGATNDVPFT